MGVFRILSLAIIVWAFPFAAVAACLNTNGNSVLCLQFNPNESFSVTPPKGWVNYKDAAKHNINIALYPEGSSWQNSEVVMYANSATKKDGQTLDAFIKADTESFKDFKMMDDKIIQLPANKKAVVKRFEYLTNKELIAYIEEEKYFAMLVVSARNEKALEKVRPVFEEFVHSYVYTSDKIHVTSP